MQSPRWRVALLKIDVLACRLRQDVQKVPLTVLIVSMKGNAVTEEGGCQLSCVRVYVSCDDGNLLRSTLDRENAGGGGGCDPIMWAINSGRTSTPAGQHEAIV